MINFSRKWLLIGGFFVILLITGFFVLIKKNNVEVVNNFPTNTLKINSQLPENKPEIKPSWWINCNDVRDIIEENDRYYVGCLGGVLVVSKDGRVIDQISMANGLGNNTVTSLVKKDNILYIGTQDGFTLYDLLNHTGKKISVNEGLVNGANIVLAEDKDKIIVGTFDGLSFYDTKTKEITNFKAELADNSTSYSVNKILVTDKAIYGIVLASAHSSGGVFRFDKTTKSWERFGVNAFIKNPDQYPRVDFFNLIAVGNNIYVANDKDVYKYEDKAQGEWEKLDGIFDILKKERPESLNVFINKIFNYNNNLFLISDSSIYKYDFENKKLVKIYPNFTEGLNPLYQTSGNLIIKNNKIYFRKNNDLFWIRWFDLDTFKTSGINLDRPYFFDKVMAIIDNNAFICADEKIYQLNFSNNTFKKWLDQKCSTISSDDNFLFQPIPKTDKIVYYYQSCGMGCSEPQLSLINFTDQSVKKIDLPANLKKELTNESNGLNWMNLSAKKYLGNKILFSFGIIDSPKKIEFNIDTQSWGQIISSLTKEEAFQKNKYFCNPMFTFENQVFKDGQSCQLGVTTDGVNWVLSEPIWENKSEKLKLIKKSPFRKDEVFNFPEKISLPYSPFENFYKKNVNTAIINKDKIYIATNVGFYIFDTKTYSWKIISTNDGLISNNVSNFAIDDKNNIILAITEGGGLSLITLRN